MSLDETGSGRAPAFRAGDRAGAHQRTFAFRLRPITRSIADGKPPQLQNRLQAGFLG
jgi:hypothetical protein